MPVSETEKRGVSSGCRFSDKPVHVPIKKRRFVLRSPSPPPAETSPCVVETADQTRSQDASYKLVPFQSSSSNLSLSQIVDTNNSTVDKDSDKSNKKFCDDEDFSGISILAAAACSSSLGKDCGYAEDGSGIEETSTLERVREVSTNTGTHSSSKALSKDDIIDSSEMSSGATLSCISAEPVGELASISTTGNSSQKDETVGKGVKDSFLGVDLCDNDEKIVGSQKPSSRDDRLHWDLNVVMDAWEQPFDDPCAQNEYSHNISEDVGKFNCNDNLGSDGHNKRDGTETVYAAQSFLLPGEPRVSVSQSAGETKDKHDMDVGSKLEQSNPNLDVMKCLVEDTKCGHQEESVNRTAELIVAAVTTPPSAHCTSNEIEDASVMSLDDNHIGYQPVMEGNKSIVGVSSFQFQNLAKFGAVAADTNITLCVSSNSDTVKEVNENVAVPELLESSKDFDREGKSLIEEVDLKTVDPEEDAEYGMPDDNGLPDIEAPNSMSKRCSVDESDAVGELQEDYDSQYEDGELRESSEFAWEEYGAMDREAGNADYVSNYREPHISYPSNYHVSASRQVDERKSGRLVIAPSVSSHDSIVDKEVYSEVAEAAGNEKGHGEDDKKLSHGVEKTEPTQENEVLESHECISEMAISGVDENGINSKMPNYNDGLLDSRSTEIKTEPKAFRRGLQSQIEAPVAHDEQLKKIDNRFEPGPMRSYDRMHYSFRNQGRGRQGGNRDGSFDSRRDIRRNYSPIIHGHSKLNDDAVVEKEDLGCIGIQDDMSYSPQLHPKNRADAEGEPCVGFRSGYKHDRRFSPDRGGGFGRGRPFRHGSFGEGRGGRGRFNGPSPDEAFQSSLKYRRPLSRRERSISPFGGRGQSNLHHSRRNSPSRSRSRSPVVWNSPMRRGAGSGGNAFFGQRSRSPSFRSEGRMQRLRSPHQQPGFGAGHVGGFRSISRNQGSPPRNRWSSARKDDQGQFMDLGYKQRGSFLDRSPGRIRFRDDRSSGIGSSRNPKPDGYYRISDRIADDDDRGRYEENFEEKRKQYQFFRPGRRNYDDGMASRLRQDNNDSFNMGNGFRDRDASSFADSRGLRGIDSRIGDGPRRFRGENHSFVCERDGKFNHNSKQFGGFDAMDSPHNLKSEEHYRPNYSGRFSAINGANRGRRFDNYADRRKPYVPTNIMRRSDNDDSEKRLRNYENIEQTPECSRATRGVDGRTGSSSTRLREDEDPFLAGQEKKQGDSSELVSVNNSGEKDATKGVDSS